LAAVTLGCADGDRYLGREPVRFETEHFRYHADPTRPLCDQTGYWLERTYAALANYLEVPPERSRKIDYYYTDARELQLACGGIASGCTVGAEQIFSETELKRHELAHIVAAQRYGHSLVLLDEGLAEMLACGVFPVIAPLLDKRLVSVETLLTLKEITGDGDPARSQNPRVIGRSLVKYLIERFGKTEFLGLYGALPAGTDLEETRAQFASRFGVSLDSVLRDWEDVKERSDESVRLPDRMRRSPCQRSGGLRHQLWTRAQQLERRPVFSVRGARKRARSHRRLRPRCRRAYRLVQLRKFWTTGA
jgi:hypothetical protein